ncbi:MAG: (2Fe-2S)-binding protein, partial [Candidatus Aenigmarchaeota archaeon]|nr:(2Fe-2S)-binding protein [Candidatus Aenigmarchaeota archaeon]
MTTKRFKIIIDGKSVVVQNGQTILDVAKKNKIDIPALCYHPDLKARANCRICVVEIKGVRGLKTACSTEVSPGMKIITNSPKVKRARKINLELIFAQHEEECSDCIWNFNCHLAKLADEYKVKTTRFAERKSKRPVYQFGPSLIFDTRKC